MYCDIFKVAIRHAGTSASGARGVNRSKRTPNRMGTSLKHRLAKVPLWDPRRLFETFSFHPLAGPVFHTDIQIILSSNHILLTYIAYFIPFISYQCQKRDSITFQKGHFCSPAPLNERQEGRLLPSAPLSGVPGSNYNKRCRNRWQLEQLFPFPSERE